MAQNYLFIAISFYRNIFLSQYLFIAIFFYQNIFLLQYLFIAIYFYCNIFLSQYLFIAISFYHNIFLSQYLFIAISLYGNIFFIKISFYPNIVQKNIVCDMDLKLTPCGFRLVHSRIRICSPVSIVIGNVAQDSHLVQPPSEKVTNQSQES